MPVYCAASAPLGRHSTSKRCIYPLSVIHRVALHNEDGVLLPSRGFEVDLHGLVEVARRHLVRLIGNTHHALAVNLHGTA